MPRRHLQALAGVTVFAAILRFSTLDVQSFWFDEAVTVQLLGLDLGDMLDAIPDSESTPPLYYVLAWFWTKLFGTGEVGLRSLSALVGTATVPVAYLIAARVSSQRAALLAAALVAVNPLLVWYSQEARSYALLVLLSALSLLFFLRALEPDARRQDLAWWAAASALAFATHYFALFVVLPEAAWLLWRTQPRRRLVLPFGVVGAVGVALLPLALDQASNSGADFIEESSLLTRIGQVPKQFLIGYDAPAEIATGVVAAALALYGLVLLIRAPEERRRVLPVAAVAVLAVALPLALALVGVDFLLARNLIAALVPALVVLAAGLALTREGTAAAVVLCVISTAVVVAVAVEPKYQREDARGAAEEVGPVREVRAVVATPFGACVPLQLYLPGSQLMPEVGAEVSEIVLLGFAQRRPGEYVDPPTGPPLRPYAESFKEVERIEADTYTLVRYRSAQPVVVGPQGLSVAGLGGIFPAIMVQRPGAATRACRPVGG